MSLLDQRIDLTKPWTMFREWMVCLLTKRRDQRQRSDEPLHPKTYEAYYREQLRSADPTLPKLVINASESPVPISGLIPREPTIPYFLSGLPPDDHQEYCQWSIAQPSGQGWDYQAFKRHQTWSQYHGGAYFSGSS